MVATALRVAVEAGSADVAIGASASAFVPIAAPIGHTSGNRLNWVAYNAFPSRNRETHPLAGGFRVSSGELEQAWSLWWIHDESSLTESDSAQSLFVGRSAHSAPDRRPSPWEIRPHERLTSTLRLSSGGGPSSGDCQKRQKEFSRWALVCERDNLVQTTGKRQTSRRRHTSQFSFRRFRLQRSRIPRRQMAKS